MHGIKVVGAVPQMNGADDVVKNKHTEVGDDSFGNIFFTKIFLQKIKPKNAANGKDIGADGIHTKQSHLLADQEIWQKTFDANKGDQCFFSKVQGP